MSSEFHPSETASLFYQSSPFALCLAFGAGLCVSSKRAGITRVFLLLFFFGHASRHAGSSFSSSSDKGWNPGPLQWKCGVLTTGLPEKSSSLSCSVGDLGLIPGLRRSPGKGKGYPFQYSGLENSLDCMGSQRIGHD